MGVKLTYCVGVKGEKKQAVKKHYRQICKSENFPNNAKMDSVAQSL